MPPRGGNQARWDGGKCHRTQIALPQYLHSITKQTIARNETAQMPSLYPSLSFSIAKHQTLTLSISTGLLRLFSSSMKPSAAHVSLYFRCAHLIDMLRLRLRLRSHDPSAPFPLPSSPSLDPFIAANSLRATPALPRPCPHPLPIPPLPPRCCLLPGPCPALPQPQCRRVLLCPPSFSHGLPPLARRRTSPQLSMPRGRNLGCRRVGGWGVVGRVGKFGSNFHILEEEIWVATVPSLLPWTASAGSPADLPSALHAWRKKFGLQSH